MSNAINTEKFKVVVIGAGQAGLSVGYFLSKLNVPFVILDANKRIGDSWRKRWDSLRLFTPAKYNGLAGLPFPAKPHYFPTKNEMADYLENYANHFNLPVRNGVKVDSLSRKGDSYFISAGEKQFKADHVVVAMANYQKPKVPAFAEELNPDIVQLHSSEYRNPSQLKEGGILIIGAGNSGAEIASEVIKYNDNVWLSGRSTGHLPFRIERTPARIILIKLVIKFLFHKIFTTNTFIGRKLRPKITSMGGPLIRQKPKDLVKAGIKRVPKVKRIKNGLPLLENNKELNIKNVIWCTGFYPGFSWIDIPVFNEKEPMHERGVVKNEPGLYFTGLHFLYALSSAMIHGVERDAEFIVKTINNRIKNERQNIKIAA